MEPVIERGESTLSSGNVLQWEVHDDGGELFVVLICFRDDPPTEQDIRDQAAFMKSKYTTDETRLVANRGISGPKGMALAAVDMILGRPGRN